MICYTLYLYNRQGVCLYYHEWSRPRPARNEAHDRKMMFGLLFSLKAFTNKMDPTSNSDHGESNFSSFRTNRYKLHFLEAATGIRLVLTTEPQAPDLREFLKYIYDTCYVECIVKNPLYTLGEPFQNEKFTATLNKAIKNAWQKGT